MKRIKQLKSEIIHNDPYCRIRKDLVEYPSGFQSDYHVIDRNNFVAIIPITENNEIYLVKQFRYPVSSFSLEFPMGAIEKDERKEEAAARELREETGIVAGKIDFLGAISPAHGALSNTAYCYVATEIKEINDPEPDESECLELHKIELDKFDELIVSKEIFDGPTIFAKYLLDMYHKKANNIS
ncbi:NUDIX hydrolase [Patescibacteria group bacterium]|nr:NUDIX hydrolase [Patescibacteria group bacterium]